MALSELIDRQKLSLAHRPHLVSLKLNGRLCYFAELILKLSEFNLFQDWSHGAMSAKKVEVFIFRDVVYQKRLQALKPPKKKCNKVATADDVDFAN